MKRKILPIILSVLLLFSLLALPVSASHAPTFTISDTATGGDCILIGIWNPATKTCTLTNDTTSHIVIGADSVTLDCNGYRIIGAGRFAQLPSLSNIGILIESRSGVTVINCHITDFAVGVSVKSSSETTITGNTADKGFIGFNLNSSSGNTLTDNSASLHGSGGFTGVGFQLASSDGNTLTGNAALNSTTGFLLIDESSSNILTENTATSNSLGFGMFSSSGNVLKGNAASNGDQGFRLSGSSGNTLTGNTAYSNITLGFFLIESPNNTLDGNTADGNNGANSSGFTLHGSPGNTLTGNTAINNPLGGFRVFSGGNTFSGNTASSNSYGFLLNGTPVQNNVFHSNTATENAQGFLVIGGATDNVITDNFILENEVGINVCRSLMHPVNTLMPNQFRGPQQTFSIAQDC